MELFAKNFDVKKKIHPPNGPKLSLETCVFLFQMGDSTVG